MNKEMYVSSTPHETKVALLEDDQLAEIYYERANEYTLAGSIYKGRVTRVLPGMQSAFVDIGLERDAFLYVSDFLDLQEEDEDEEFGEVKVSGPSLAKANGFVVEKHDAAEVEEEDEADEGEEAGEPSAPAPGNAAAPAEGDEADSRRWRGRRRRRGRRGGRDRNNPTSPETANGEAAPVAASPADTEEAFVEEPEDGDEQVEHVAHASSTGEAAEFEEAVEPEDHASGAEPALLPGETRAPRGPRSASDPAPAERTERFDRDRGGRGDSRGRGGRDRGGRDRGGRDRGDRGGRGRDRDDRPRSSHEPETALPTNYTPILLPGESLSKYRGAPAAQVHETEARQAFDAAVTPQHEPYPEAPAIHHETRHETEHEPTEASAEVRERPAIAPFRAESKTEEPVAEEQKRFRDMNVASVFAGPELVEEEVVEEDEQVEETVIEHAAPVEHDTHVHDNHTVETTAGEAHWSDVPAKAATEADLVETEDEHEARTHQEGNYSPEGSGTVLHEEMDEEEADMPSASDHYRRHDLDDDSADRQHDFATRLGDAAGLLGDAVRETDEEHAIDQDEYEFNGNDEFEESEMLAAGEVLDEVEGEEDKAVEGSEASETAPAEGSTRPQRRGRPGFDRPGRDRGRRDRSDRGGDRGRGRMGSRGGRPRREARVIPLISDVLKEGQEILVQIAKEPIGKKGARITSHIALPGRFLVYMPTVNHIGVSRKIDSDEERQRLKRIVASERENGHGGFIVRTAAANIKEDDLRADIRFLKHLWHEIRERSESSKSPSLIYHDLNLVERILRDQVTQDFSQIWVDTESEYERVVRFASRFQPNLVRRIKLYTKDTPLYEQFGIQEEINKSLKAKVWLKSGGYIVINQTEALVAIDINTGKYVGKTQRLEDTIVKTNVDAIKEIVRQVRLRDLGGIIVIDFIDMDERRNRQKVMIALEEALKSDRAPSKVLQFNDFGLVAITRKRVKQSLERTLGTPCPYCEATGFVKSVTTMCNEIYTELRKVRNHIDSNEVTLRVHPEVAKELKGDKGKWIMEMEEMIGHPILLKSDPAVHQEQFDLNF